MLKEYLNMEFPGWDEFSFKSGNKDNLILNVDLNNDKIVLTPKLNGKGKISIDILKDEVDGGITFYFDDSIANKNFRELVPDPILMSVFSFLKDISMESEMIGFGDYVCKIGNGFQNKYFNDIKLCDSIVNLNEYITDINLRKNVDSITDINKFKWTIYSLRTMDEGMNNNCRYCLSLFGLDIKNRDIADVTVGERLEHGIMSKQFTPLRNVEEVYIEDCKIDDFESFKGIFDDGTVFRTKRLN